MKSRIQTAATSLKAALLMGFTVFSLTGAAIAQDNILVNGDFATGNLNNWTTFLADWEGVTGNFAVVDGVASITGLANAQNVVWHVQLNQIFSAAQRDELEVGKSYKVSFDARSNVDGRPLKVFFGEEGGGFAAIKELQVTLSTTMQTFETVFELPIKYGNMKLGFEMGLSNNDVYLDNVSLTETDEDPGNGTPEGLNLPVTFNDTELDYQLTDFGGAASEIVVDPTDANNRVARTVKTVAAELWAGTTVGGTAGFTTAIPFAPGSTTMSVRVWSPTADTPVRLKVENSNDPTVSVETEARTTVAGEWETLVFNFANQAGGTAAINFASSYNMASIFFNFGTTGEQAGEQTYYWDDMEFGGTSGSPTAPGAPVGFVALNDPAGVPMGNGELFLAVGPNNTEQPNISYRMFYALTSAGVEDPKTATQYVFGTTTGDNGGNGAFGFVLGGLQPGVSYTFWLYQYDSSTEQYSETPAVATAVSTGSTSVDGDGSLPTTVSLSQNYPNPFIPSTLINFELPESGAVTLQVYNMVGQLMATLLNENMSAGSHTVNFDAANLASGTYIYRLQTADVVLTKKMTLLK